MGKEIERKFLVSEIPEEMIALKHSKIHQNYLATGYEEVRIRKETVGDISWYTMTIKKDTGLCREEINIDISSESYEQLNNNKQGISRRNKPLLKERTTFESDGYKLEVDIYMNFVLQSIELMVVEVEFRTIEEANAFQPLQWFGKEVTEDINYKNQYLWKRLQ